MSRRCQSCPRRSGLSLLEVVLATGLTTMLVLPTIGVLQTSFEFWDGFETRHTRHMQREAVMRFMTRQLQRTEEILSMEPTGLVLRLDDGRTVTWWTRNNRVWLREGRRQQLLGDDIRAVQIQALASDGATQVLLPSQAHLIRVTFQFGTPQKNNEVEHTRTVWIRRWL